MGLFFYGVMAQRTDISASALACQSSGQAALPWHDSGSAAAAAEGFVDRADDLLATEFCPVCCEEHVVEALAVAVEDGRERLRDLAEALGKGLGLLRHHVWLEEDEFLVARLCRGRMRLHLRDAVLEELARALRQALRELLLLLLQARNAIRKLRLLDGQEVRGIEGREHVLLDALERLTSAEEADARALLVLLDLEDLDETDHAARSRMRAAAGAGVAALHRDDAQDARELVIELAQVHLGRLFSRHELRRDGAVLLDLPVREALGLQGLLPVDLLVEVDADHVRTHVEAHIVRAEELVEGIREHVLAAVLLHVVEADGPVELCLHLRARFQGLLRLVEDLARLLVDMRDGEHLARRRQRARVAELAAALREEHRLVEHDGIAPVIWLRAHDLCLTFPLHDIFVE